MRLRTRSALLASAHALSTAAFGQDASAPAAAPTGTAQPAAPGSAAAVAPDADRGIQDIVVTATRREERLQRIPVTVTAVSGATLTRSGIIETKTLMQIVPGLTMTRAASLGQPVIRGVGSTGTSNGDESNVATYINGVYQADPYATIMELVNVQRVEVLRGPQGTVFGRNATGGLINIITPDPSFTTSGSLAASYARMRNDADGVDLRGYVTGPLSSKLAADLSALYRHDDGYVRDLVGGGVYGRNTVFTLRGQLLFQPSAGTKIVLTSDYARQDGQTAIYQPVGRFTRGIGFPGVVLPTKPWQASLDVLPILDYRRFSTSVRASFDLGFANLETTSAHTYSKAIQQSDTDSTNIRIAGTQPNIVTRTYSQEVRLLSNPGRFTWLAGVYAFHLGSSAPIYLNTSPAPPAPLVPLLILPTVRTTSYAGFAEGSLELLPKLFVTAGARYTTEHRSLVSNLNGELRIPHTSRRYNRATYRVAARYQVTDKTNFYGSYGTGFKSGVFNSVATILNVVDPEEIKAKEIGVKSDLATWARVNLSTFRYDYDNLQVTARSADGSGAYVLQNAAKARI